MKQKLQPAAADYRKLSDEDLVHRFVHRHENNAINSLFERYGHLVFGICLKYVPDAFTAKDITEKIFIKLLEDLKVYHVDHFKQWLFRYVNSYCRAQTGGEAQVVNNVTVTDGDFDEEVKIETEEMTRALEKAVEGLNLNQRKCLELFYLKNMNYSEIEKQTGFTNLQIIKIIQSAKHILNTTLSASERVKQ